MTAQLDAGTTGEGDATAPAGTTRRRRSARGPRAGMPIRRGAGVTLGLVTLWLTLLVLLPLIAVVGKAFDDGWSGFWSAITNPSAATALRLTVGLSLIVAIVGAVMGTVVAWVLVREPFRGSRLLDLVIDIPFALPTIVAGIVMLAVYGSGGVGPDLFGTRLGLFVTLLFVTLPFTVRTVQPVLLDLDRDAEQAAASLGASPAVVFRRIVLPQLRPALASGAALAFARALGEYGSLVFISSNLANTKVASALIYGKYQDAENPLALQQGAAISTVLLLASAIVLVLLDLVQRRAARRG
ncbi:sulfate transport system permease protein [Jatrophihabitans endophyticus]|uniref:Sulfate transport system permease protein n=1 Tax=Jatrophihabitans endophyticus TaxID=1206085 RepID=A0A1M5MIA1_9ACTN|nr:ABC transporter permease subunit [Jatrophihabitans endophyticus]SHG76852.1 sulfate transport system permease protein [Jatrophihabitans endophyticus]